MGETLQLLFDRGGMVECRLASHLHFVGEETDSAIIRYGFTPGPDSPGDLVQALPAEARCALCIGEWVGGEIKGHDNLPTYPVRIRQTAD